MKTASDFLHECAEVLDERGRQYDQPDGERSMGKNVKAFEIITGKHLTEAEGWLFLQLLKDVRQWSREKYHEDSAVDCVSYAALKGEALSRADDCTSIDVEKKCDDAWIEWNGGDCPVPLSCIVDIFLRNGDIHTGCADTADWAHDGLASDIIKYKLSTKEQ